MDWMKRGERTDGWMNGRMEGWKDGFVFTFPFPLSPFRGGDKLRNFDQASNLREIVNSSNSEGMADLETQGVYSQPAKRLYSIAVTSGKGGVGKTNLSANLGIAMAQYKRVAIIDADLGLANVDVLFNVSPKYTLKHVLSGEKELSEVIVKPVSGVNFIPGSSGIEALANLPEEHRNKLITAFRQLDADVLIVDTAAGIAENVISFALAADEVLVITTPDPSAVRDAYAIIKVILKRAADTNIKLIVNMVKNRQEAYKIARAMYLVAKRFLKFNIKYIGYIPFDKKVREAASYQVPFVMKYPKSNAAKCINMLANKLLSSPVVSTTGDTEEMEEDFFSKLTTTDAVPLEQ